jgi:PIN domain nuclease of toxin-antitoxin system
MNIFKKNISGLEAEAKQLTETNEQLTKDLAEAQALALPNTEEIATLTNANAVLQTKLDTSEASLVTLTAERDTEQQAAVTAQADFDGKVATEVAKQIADGGLEVGKIDSDDTRELSVLEQMNDLEGDAQATFFKENKSAILALHALKK